MKELRGKPEKSSGMLWTIWWKSLIFLWRSRHGIPFSLVAEWWIPMLWWGRWSGFKSWYELLTRKVIRSFLCFWEDVVHDIWITYWLYVQWWISFCLTNLKLLNLQHLKFFLCFTAFGTCADQVPEGQPGTSLEPCGRGSLDSGPQSHQLSNFQCLWSMMLIPPSLPFSISFFLPDYYIHSFRYESYFLFISLPTHGLHLFNISLYTTHPSESRATAFHTLPDT